MYTILSFQKTFERTHIIIIITHIQLRYKIKQNK